MVVPNVYVFRDDIIKVSEAKAEIELTVPQAEELIRKLNEKLWEIKNRTPLASGVERVRRE